MIRQLKSLARRLLPASLIVRTLWHRRFRGKVRLLSPLVPASGTRTARVFGATVALDLSDYVQRMMYLGCFEREETSLVRRYLKPGMTVVDVGANAGYYSYLAASLVGPTGRVIAIEPDPVHAQSLAAAIRANALANVVLLNVGLGRESGELALHIPPDGHANRAATMTPVPGWTPITVPVRPLDELLPELAVSTIHLLKLDVEGFEGEVLRGASATLMALHVAAILCEFNTYWLRQHDCDPEELWAFIEGHGFRADRPRPRFTPHGVVNAFFVRG